ncbi:hypothetical protein [Fluviicola taffensis]|uniref:Uncharacterized protein n=1 Tax=Fluviicola taffensis (strain DSM 16823 / NCIMB 13979 / RW262) TaxID=755732 RepID=F2IFK3_FLUTR|nr:hypothetical protein [Fluviicola taffensis]AEA45717.1 hypothetical protein Fluta_3750 [Fluviicola taffensis DSM 16823]
MKNLKKIGLAMVIFTSFTSFAFAGSKKSKAKKVPYTVAQRYFVNNTVEDGVFFYPKITNQEEFDKLFGMATVMGKNGSPTPIDFSKQYVIAVIDMISNKEVKLEPKSLLKLGTDITFTYLKTEETSTSSTYFRRCLILVVDKKYDGKVTIEDANQQGKIAFKVADRYFVNNTVEKGEFFYPKITTQEEFDKLFGMAPIMGENGMPTEIDFSKQFVIAIIDAETNKQVEFSVESLVKKDGVITLNYRKTDGLVEQNASYRYCFLVIVDKINDGEVKFALQK